MTTLPLRKFTVKKFIVRFKLCFISHEKFIKNRTKGCTYLQQERTRKERVWLSTCPFVLKKMIITYVCNKINLLLWRCRELNPVPLACKASALPYDLHPLYKIKVPNVHEEVSSHFGLFIINTCRITSIFV